VGKSKIHCLNAWDYPEWKKDVNNDKRLVSDFSEILGKFDYWVTQNGVSFDARHLNTRLKKWKLPLLPKTPHVDTKIVAQKNLYSFNNRLGYLGEWMAGDKKLDNGGWDLWVRTWHRDPKALKLMTRYCKQDVNLLEKAPERVCPGCGGVSLRSLGWRYTQTNSYRRLRCNDCGNISRLDTKEKKPRSVG
jgi:RNase P subunit RPR2